MNFSGWQPVSLVDYPKAISTVLFTSKCNFNCAYCHNPSLKIEQPAIHTEKAIFEYLERRREQIDALVVSGGEPSLYAGEIIDFSHRLKKRFPNIRLKVDTNGSNPLFLQEGREVFGFIAMDVKSLHYEPFSSISFDTILKSLDILPLYDHHEARITVYPPYLPESDFETLGRLLKEKRIQNVAIQQYRSVDNIPPYPPETLHAFADTLRALGLNVTLRI
ncbi:MAG TPA: radical SAM protein [Thermotogota bacterium]|nr:radical SAM protein [Thermotogota bacterium]